MSGAGAAVARLRFEGASVGYAGRAVVSEVTLELRAGEVLTLVGPNGSGKSTLLKSATRQLELLGGAVYLDGEQLRSLSWREVAERASVLLTRRPDPELMTCRDVVATGRAPYTGRLGLLGEEDRARVEECIGLVGAAEVADRDFSEVSDGQRQRVLLARALAQDPDVMVLDEPTSFLDVRHKLDLLDILRRHVRERGVAVLMSLHEVDLAERASDVVACVRGGAVGPVGPPDEVLTAPGVRELFGLDEGSFDASYCSVELGRPQGAPQAFVVGGAGKGVRAYRALARDGVPFAAGVLHEGDLDLPAARALAAEVVAERAFRPIGDAAFGRAEELVRACPVLVCCLGEGDLGPGNARNRELVELARSLGKEVRRGV